MKPKTLRCADADRCPHVKTCKWARPGSHMPPANETMFQAERAVCRYYTSVKEK